MVKIVVAGASGNLGQLIAHHLAAQGAANSVRLAARDVSKLAKWAEQGFETVHADYNDTASLDAAFAGAEIVLFISSQPDLFGDVLLRKRHHDNVIASAERVGVHRIVYTSATAPLPIPGKPVPDDHFHTELRLFRSNLSWTILRNNLYAELITENAIAPALQTGKYLTSSGEGRIGYVSRDDLARTAAHVALSPPEGNRIYDLTNTETYSGADVAQLLAELTGKPVEYVSVPTEQHKAVLTGAAGLPEVVADFLVWFDHLTTQGVFGLSNNTIAELTGSPPKSLREVISAHLESTK